MKGVVVYEKVELKMYLHSQGTSFCGGTMLNRTIEQKRLWNFDRGTNLT